MSIRLDIKARETVIGSKCIFEQIKGGSIPKRSSAAQDLLSIAEEVCLEISSLLVESIVGDRS